MALISPIRLETPLELKEPHFELGAPLKLKAQPKQKAQIISIGPRVKQSQAGVDMLQKSVVMIIMALRLYATHPKSLPLSTNKY